MNILKAVLFTLITFALLLAVSAVAAKVDSAFGFEQFQSAIAAAAGAIFLLFGFILRLWGTWVFYKNHLKVISTRPQETFLTAGPYKFSRNPLFLAVIFILFGAALVLGSLSAMLFSLAVFGLLNRWVRIEEKQLAAAFGEDYLKYKKQVRRWV